MQDERDPSRAQSRTDPAATLTLHALAEAADVTVRTIRYYITEGLLPPPIGAGPATVYTPGHLDRLRLIARLKDAYLPLKEIRRQLTGLDDAAVRAALASPPQAPTVSDAPSPPRPERTRGARNQNRGRSQSRSQQERQWEREWEQEAHDQSFLGSPAAAAPPTASARDYLDQLLGEPTRLEEPASSYEAWSTGPGEPDPPGTPATTDAATDIAGPNPAARSPVPGPASERRAARTPPTWHPGTPPAALPRRRDEPAADRDALLPAPALLSPAPAAPRDDPSPRGPVDDRPEQQRARDPVDADATSWRRVRLSDDAELLIREPVFRKHRDRIEWLIGWARRVFD